MHIRHKLHQHIHRRIIDNLLKIVMHQNANISLTLLVNRLRLEVGLQITEEIRLDVIAHLGLFEGTTESELRHVLFSVLDLRMNHIEYTHKAECRNSASINGEVIQKTRFIGTNVDDEQTANIILGNLEMMINGVMLPFRTWQQFRDSSGSSPYPRRREGGPTRHSRE